MYNPELNDNYYEWIELYNPTDDPINLTNWILTDNYENETLQPDLDHGNGSMIIPPKGFAMITDQGTKFYDNYSISADAIKLYVDDSSIGNGLGNSGDKLILKNDSDVISDSMEWIIDYEDVPGTPIGPALDDHSLSRYKNLDTDNSIIDFFEASNPTPGGENKKELKPSFDVDLYPEYVPKVEKDSLYGHPFAIKINVWL